MGGCAGCRRHGASGWVALAALAWVGIAACASDKAPAGGRFTHPEAGYSIAWPGAEWKRAGVENADLALRDPRGSTLTLIRRCRIPLAEPGVLARHLRFGLEASELRSEGPVDTPWGDPAWEQRFSARGDGRTVHVKAVTSTRAPCVFDWLLTTGGPPEAVEATFDGWWRSFQPGPTEPTAARLLERPVLPNRAAR